MFPPAVLDALRNIHNTARTDLRNENFSAAEFTHLAWNSSCRSTAVYRGRNNISTILLFYPFFYRFVKILKCPLHSRRFMYFSVHSLFYFALFIELCFMSNLRLNVNQDFFSYMFPHNKYSTYLALVSELECVPLVDVPRIELKFACTPESKSRLHKRRPYVWLLRYSNSSCLIAGIPLISLT